ncbi:Zinc finger, RING/FYVE/PHD-type [Artemisia annua]|uniref:Zinc finger, RING/FYVE/PHD-type n=1 Tax=Artemisia annua TaxID=35608 RepID=A0A2U1NTC9_ARTAN|nr:Zinc finger, RING/FYVE/PHD-type [Artemisia annua]
MNRGNRRRWPSWNNLKKRLGLKRINIMGFCGSSKWFLDTDKDEEPLIIRGDQSPTTFETIVQESPDHGTITMNLATALAADRKRTKVGQNGGNKVKPLKSIFRLYEDIDHGRDEKVADEDGGIGNMCSLCTERNKGAALIPCGHTYCRVCSRAMWFKKGSCPLCNRLITEILEIL